jgi:hypothetical protein
MGVADNADGRHITPRQESDTETLDPASSKGSMAAQKTESHPVDAGPFRRIPGSKRGQKIELRLSLAFTGCPSDDVLQPQTYGARR